MIPCQATCGRYCEGCHKNCARWKEFLYQSSIERKEKKAYLDRQKKKVYLDYYNQLNSVMLHQFLKMQPHAYHR